ncbi:hypothetical protein HYT53_05420 [Candidatus Woesearchaeota archaeon]|nr:hypothetical protein [Candidatus Woesearchaeota archaeon]
MGMLRVLSFMLFMLVFANIANAATIHGTVYDLSLKKAGNARVEINTLPKQVMVAQNGSYSCACVSPGEHHNKAGRKLRA